MFITSVKVGCHKAKLVTCCLAPLKTWRRQHTVTEHKRTAYSIFELPKRMNRAFQILLMIHGLVSMDL